MTAERQARGVEEVRARHERDVPWLDHASIFTAAGRQAHADRAWLLEEVARLEGQNALIVEDRDRVLDQAIALQERAEAAEAERDRLREALAPFGSGEWGIWKAWLVAGAEASRGDRELGIKSAALLTRWQVAADAALALTLDPEPGR